MADLATWRANRQTNLELPSGLTVVVRKATLIDLAARGAIPTPLYAQVQELMDRGKVGAAPQIDLSTLADQAALIDVVAAAALVDPAVADVADEAHIMITELTFEDRLAIFTWAQGGAAALAPFPGAQSDVGASDPPRGRSLPPVTERVDAGLVE